MKTTIFAVFFCLQNLFIFSQIDTNAYKLTKYTNDFKFEEGIFLSIQQARNNTPISKSKIISSYDYKDFNFFENIFS